MISFKLISKIKRCPGMRCGFAMVFIILLITESHLIFAQSNAHNLSNTITPFKVVANVPSWSASDETLPFNKVTHIQYSYVRPTLTGGLTLLDNPQKLKDIVTKAHSKNVLVSIAVGGWSDLKNEDFQAMASQSATRNKFINSLLSLVSKYQLDGVDVNWQYPSTDVDQTNYTILLTELSTALHAKEKYLSTTVAAAGEYADKIQNQVFSVVDFLNLQAYDARTGDGYSTFQYASSAIQYWIHRGVPSSKVVLGIPFHAQPTWKSYNTLISEGANANIDSYKGNSYNGLYTVKQKTKLALDQHIGGIMISDVTQDATGENSLVRAIYQTIPQSSSDLRKSIPFDGTRHSIPGIIEAEQYDIGPEGIAYHDLMLGNSGGTFRADGVDVEVNASGNNDFKIASIQKGEWLAYSVNVTTSGPLNLEVQVASAYGNKSFHIEMDGINISGQLLVPNTGGWGDWQTVKVTTTKLKPGKKLMRVVMDDGDFNLNRITFSSLPLTELIQTQEETEVKEEVVAGLTLHPNPGVSGVSQEVILTLDSPDHHNVSVLVTDISGAVMFKEVYPATDEKNIRMSLPELPHGIYILKVRSNKNSWTERYYVK